jgi:hypothetical protein
VPALTKRHSGQSQLFLQAAAETFRAMTAWPGFSANAKAAKSARQTPFILCALAPLRLGVDFFRRGVAGETNCRQSMNELHHVSASVKNQNK